VRMGWGMRKLTLATTGFERYGETARRVGTEVRFATDSSLEGAGFEPSVPRKTDNAL